MHPSTEGGTEKGKATRVWQSGAMALGARTDAGVSQEDRFVP